MSDTRLSAVVSESYTRLTTAYNIARHVLKPNPYAILWLIGASIALGTVGSLSYIMTAPVGKTLLTNPAKMGAVAVLYAGALLSLYTIGSMIREFDSQSNREP